MRPLIEEIGEERSGNREQPEALDLDASRTPTVNIADAARHLGISRSTAYAAADAGHIPTIRVGLRRRVVPTAALLRLLDLPVVFDQPKHS